MIIQTAMSIELYLVFSSLCFSTGSLVYSLRKETVPDCYRLCIKKNQVQNGSKCNETSTDGFKDLCGTGMISFINAHCKKLCSTSTRHIQNDTTVRGSRKVQSVESKARWVELGTFPPDICGWVKEQKCKECKAGEICSVVNHDCINLDNFHIICIDTRMPSVSVALQNNTVNDSCNQTLYFMCTSDEITVAEPNSLFKMYWYIDGEESYVSKTEYKSDIQKTYLTEYNGFYRLGVKVSCKYSSHLSIEDEGKLSPISAEFFAGIKILNTPITIEKEKQTLIKFQLTVPFGCRCNTGLPSTLTIEMRSPDSARCDGINGFDKCGMTIRSNVWNVIQSIVVKHSGNHKYQLTYGPQRRVQLQTKPLRVHPIWSNFILPEIFIHIVNKSEIWKSKVCYSHSDPHMRTFDGKFYDNHNSGTFIMYESNDDKGNIMQVQTKLTYCNKQSGPGIMCNCAVAVRAAADVFVINRCPGDEEKFEFKNCLDNVLDVRKEDSFNYKIYFPTGTHVHLRLWKFQTEMVIEVDIFPSIFDENVSKGLCSKLGSNTLIGSDNTVFRHTQRPDAFSKSWIVPSKDNLFEMKNFENLDRMKSLALVCTCNERQPQSGRGFGDGGHVLCGKDAECPRGDVQITKNKCIVREKRNIKSSFSYIPTPIKMSKRSLGLVKTIFNQTTTNMMTYKEALDFCKNIFNASIGFQACSQLSILEHDKYIADCALDIELTNSTAWASTSLEGYKNRCMNEVKQNNTLQREGNSSSIADTIRRALCKNECSGHGSCIQGNCHCDENFGAADCSQDLRDPPYVYAVNHDSGGLCDERDCLEVDINGDMFLDERGLTCKFTRFQASLSNEKVFFESRSTNATHNTLSNIDCEIPNDWRNMTSVTSAALFVTGFTVSVSNDGRHFSAGQPLYILDSICQDTINIDGNLEFILKKNFCFIRGICVPNATVTGLNNCSICISELNSFDWTVQYDRQECNILDSNNHVKSLIVAICLIGIATIFVLFLIVVLKVFKHNTSDAEDIFSRPPPHYDSPKPKFNMRGI